MRIGRGDRLAKNGKVGIVPHPYRVSDKLLADRIIPDLEKRGFEHIVIRPPNNEVDPAKPAEIPAGSGISLIIVVGGDGTFLGASRLAARAGVPIIGVEVGNLGFLCQSKLETFNNLAKVLAAGDFETEERMMIEGHIVRDGQILFSNIALNDIVVGNAQLPRMLDLDCYVSGTYLVSYLADGLIVSTPTGSTAYAMAAGGPIIAPTLNSFILTPICAHSLYIRPVVVPDTELIKVAPDVANPPIMATFDGQVFYNLAHGDEVHVQRYHKNLKLIRLHEFNFFDTLMKKFKWGFKHTGE